MVDTTNTSKEVYARCAGEITERLKVAPMSEGALALEMRIRRETDLFAIVLATLVAKHGGWMLLTAFTVSFVECLKTLDVMEGKEKEAMELMMQSVIGSFGRTVQ